MCVFTNGHIWPCGLVENKFSAKTLQTLTICLPTIFRDVKMKQDKLYWNFRFYVKMTNYATPLKIEVTHFRGKS